MTSLFKRNHQRRGHYRNNCSAQTTSLAVSRSAYVTRDIHPGKAGRLHYRATEWNAKAVDGTYIPADTPVTLIQRDGNTWLVQAASSVEAERAA